MICDFCYRHCEIEEGKEGFCRVRKVEGGKLITSGYGYLEALAIDPVEKKPLYHFLPGTKTLSVAEIGCNYHCEFCQNWQISQSKKSSNSNFVSPEKLVALAIKYNTPSISFTYTEPIVWQDYVINTAKLAKNKGIKTIMVTNGSFSKEARLRLVPLIDAFNIDLKGNSDYYKKICKGELEPVLDGIDYIVLNNGHVEVTTLLIEGIHTKAIVRELGEALKTRGVQVWHLTRFFPSYKMSDRPATSESFLLAMIKLAKSIGIPYVYGGNTTIISPTVCPSCGQVLISNHEYENNAKIECEQNIKENKCIYCNNPIYGRF